MCIPGDKDISDGGRVEVAVVVVASEDSLHSMTKGFTVFLLMVVCVVGAVLGIKTLCCNSRTCMATNNDIEAPMMGRVCEEENEVSFTTGKTELLEVAY